MFARIRMSGSLFLLAITVRAIGFPTVFSNGGVQLPYAGDAFYHLRRIWFSVARFPETLSFDRYVSFPDGSQIIWPATFDWTIAALIRPFVDPTDQVAVEAIAVWVPVVLGAATTGLLSLLADRLYGRAAGWTAGLIYCVLPISFVYSQLGMIDHHVAVALLSTIVLWLSCAIVSSSDRAQTWVAAIALPTTRLYSALGVGMAITILTWTGSILHVGVLQLAFGLRWLMTKDREVARARAIQFSVTQAVVAICIAPFSLGTWQEFSAWSPLVLSGLQPIYFASAAATICLVQVIHEHSSIGASRGRRVASGISLALAGALIALLLFEPLRTAIISAGGWFSESEQLLSLASEMRPILWIRGVFDFRFAIERFGTGFLVLPFAWLYLARRAITTRNASEALVLFWTLAFAALTLRQWRFGNTLAVVYAILIGAVLAEWIVRVRSQVATRPRHAFRPILEILVVSAMIVLSVAAFANFYRPIIRMNAIALRDESQRNLGPLHPSRRIYDEAGRWLAKQTPKTSGYLESDSRPEYGVLADWGSGHLLRYRSERPMVQDPFGAYAGKENFEAAWAYFAERQESTAIEILERLGVRYVVAGPMGAGLTNGIEPDAMAVRLWTAFGSFLPIRQAQNAKPLFGLARHRLIYFAHTLPRHRQLLRLNVPTPFTSLGIWEIVSGAQIQGTSEPSAVIDLRLDLGTTSNARQSYRRRTVADDNGKYDFVVPYPTDIQFSEDVKAIGRYHISSVRFSQELEVREADVQSGNIVRGPDL